MDAREKEQAKPKHMEMGRNKPFMHGLTKHVLSKPARLHQLPYFGEHTRLVIGLKWDSWRRSQHAR